MNFSSSPQRNLTHKRSICNITLATAIITIARLSVKD